MTAQGRPPTEPSAPAERHVQRGWVLGWLVVAAASGVGLIAAWVVSASVEVLASLATLGGLAVTVVLHQAVVVHDGGERTAPRPEEPASPWEWMPPRRTILGGLAAVATIGLAAVAGLVRFGPRRPGTTAWDDGVRLVTIEGTPLRPQDIPLGGVVTVWPDGSPGTELAATMLIRLREPPQPPTDLDAVVDQTLVAYSRLCTHAGCAVALYRDFDQALFCPCHQATFDARRGAQPTFGPASHPLPQLPIGLDDDGFLVARGDFSSPPGAVGGTVTS